MSKQPASQPLPQPCSQPQRVSQRAPQHVSGPCPVPPTTLAPTPAPRAQSDRWATWALWLRPARALPLVVASLAGLGWASPARAQPPSQTVTLEEAITLCSQQIGQQFPIFSQDQARAYCDCSFRTLSETQSAEEISRLARQVKPNDTSSVPPEWLAVANRCLQRALTEQ